MAGFGGHLSRRRLSPQRTAARPTTARTTPYSQSVEQRIVAALGAIYGPYSGACFAHTGQTDIEHMVATSEAHDSGLCACQRRDSEGRVRHRPAESHARESQRQSAPERAAKDVAEWTPDLNSVLVRQRGRWKCAANTGLTIDRSDEARSRGSGACRSVTQPHMVVVECRDGTSAGAFDTSYAIASASHDDDVDALARWDDNGNGQITCAEARRHGIAPVSKGHPAYPYMRDGDGDGVVCE